ncbi:TAXI family TRAP transporter solute-binding subunit [Dethiobacter alkaliphilus]|uniref:TRAP transporter solute receptor, TAXI family n=1 Tax=Dethiobacter alkaliphilus AHT 1 TaxID=555088 RepID=C0GKX9_DETAL|nr:TAXI family TRAP transporter solute-binding subunit [Dethiobacter alkaliphilus]EEG76009.1 TRAP transporter solute receptor, TAXI family [Dethiobacter alkaliphilus AHT 1]MCW3491677.1 TAXI family TRAP transporter solute-binding subunit [Dethiobacter alkaliphilus]
MRSKRLSLFLVVLLVLSIFAIGGCGEGNNNEEPADNGDETATVQRLNMGSGWVTGVYYPLAGAMSRIAHEAMDNISLTVESSGASVVNVKLIGSGDLDLAIVQNDVAYYAYNGLFRDDFKENPVTNMKGLFTLYPEPVQLVASVESGISSPADLAGKRIAVGPLGSGAEVNAMQIIEVYGMELDDFAAVERLEAGEAADYLKDGRVDAAFFTVGIGASVIADLAVTSDIVVVDIDDEKAEELMELEDFYARATIPGDVYNNVPEANTIAVVSMVVAHEDLSEELMYEFVKGIFDNVETIHNAHAIAGKLVTLETALDGMPLDLHPGAERFFEEVGMR